MTSYTEVDCKSYDTDIFNGLSDFVSDMKIGRNLARSLLEYYRFTNILPIPPLKEILCKRKGRSKNKNQRRKFRYELKPRSKSSRPYAPINYTDLSIYCDSDTSCELSPIRSSYQRNFVAYQNRLNRYNFLTDLSLPCLKTLGRESDSEFIEARKIKKKKALSTLSDLTGATSKVEIINTPPKPYLSIIDFNLLCRGSLEEAASVNKLEKVCSRHNQKVRTKPKREKSK